MVINCVNLSCSEWYLFYLAFIPRVLECSKFLEGGTLYLISRGRSLHLHSFFFLFATLNVRDIVIVNVQNCNKVRQNSWYFCNGAYIVMW